MATRIDMKMMFRIVNLVIVLGIAYFVASMVSLRIEQNLVVNGLPESASHASRTVVPQANSLEDYNIILTRNIFNAQAPETESLLDPTTSSDPSVNERNAIMSPMVTGGSIADFILRGVVYLGDQSSAAIFERKNDRRQLVFRQGDEIVQGVTLKTVKANSVVVSTSTGERELAIERIKIEPLRGNSRITGSMRGIHRRDRNSFEINKSTLDRSLKNINQIISQIAMRPKMENNVCVGYEVRRIRPGSVFESIGLQRGDVLQRVNGMDLSDPEDAFRVYKSLIGETSFNIDLMRNGQRTTLNYEIR